MVAQGAVRRHTKGLRTQATAINSPVDAASSPISHPVRSRTLSSSSMGHLPPVGIPARPNTSASLLGDLRSMNVIRKTSTIQSFDTMRRLSKLESLWKQKVTKPSKTPTSEITRELWTRVTYKAWAQSTIEKLNHTDTMQKSESANKDESSKNEPELQNGKSDNSEKRHSITHLEPQQIDSSMVMSARSREQRSLSVADIMCNEAFASITSRPSLEEITEEAASADRDWQSAKRTIPSLPAYVSIMMDAVKASCKESESESPLKQRGRCSLSEECVDQDIPMAPRFASALSKEAQCAILKGYDDIIMETMIELKPGTRRLLKKTKTPSVSMFTSNSEIDDNPMLPKIQKAMDLLDNLKFTQGKEVTSKRHKAVIYNPVQQFRQWRSAWDSS